MPLIFFLVSLDLQALKTYSLSVDAVQLILL